MSLVGTLGRDEERMVVGGVEYRLTPPTLQAYLDMERDLRQIIGSPLRNAARHAASVPPEHAASYWAAAHKAEAEWADRDILQMASLELRIAAIAYLLLHRYHHDQIRTIDQAAAWLTQVDLEQFQQVSSILMPPKEGKARPTIAPQTGQV